MDTLHVRNSDWKGRSLIVGEREVGFDPRGISEPLTEEEHESLQTIPGVTGVVWPGPAEEIPEDTSHLTGAEQMEAYLAAGDMPNPVPAPDPTAELVAQFKGLPVEDRLEMVDNGAFSGDQLRAMFNSEAKWPKSRRVLEAIDRAIGKAEPRRSAESINRALLKASTPVHVEQ